VSSRSRYRRFILAMLLVGMQLMLMAPVGIQAQGTSFTAIPRGDTWKYQVVVHGAGAGFEAVGFDDSAWPAGPAAFGTAGICSWINTTTVKTSWPINTDILLRKEITLPAGANNLQVKGDIDNNATVYINGVQIGHVVGGSCVQNLINFTAPDSVLQTGSNIIAIRGHDEGVVNFLDVQVTYEVAPNAELCQPGTFSVSGSEPCIPAPAGSYVDTTGATEATLCPAGTFSATSGAIACTPAPHGSYVDSPGAVAATPCAAGSFQDQPGQTSCVLAQPGSYVATTGAAAAILCPAGTFSATLGAIACTPAAAGSYVATIGAIAATPCPAGTFSATSGAIACTLAPAGSFVATTGATEATLCAAGSYQDQAGQTSCLLAQPGYYVATTGATAQTPCPSGTTSGVGATACQPIPVLYVITGFYQPVDMNGVLNTVKGGATVPLKFEVFAGSSEVTDLALVSMSAKQISCPAGAATEDIEVVATGGTSLRYDTTSGQFIYNWQTPKKANTCYAVTATTSDGSFLTALFKLK
jgi:hypothetical protein